MPGHNFWVIFLLLVYRNLINLGKPPDKKSAVFLTLFKRGGGAGASCFRIGGAEDNFIFYIECCFIFVLGIKLK